MGSEMCIRDRKNNFVVQRGAYVIAAVLDESISSKPVQIKGLYIDLFDKDLPVISQKKINPGEQAYLYDLRKITEKSKAHVLCGASRISDERLGEKEYSFIAKSPLNTTNVSRIYLPSVPKEVMINGEHFDWKSNWDKKSSTLLVRFENNPDGVEVNVKW